MAAGMTPSSTTFARSFCDYYNLNMFGTTIEEKMKRQASIIYDALLKTGFPSLINAPLAHSDEQIKDTLQQYFQPTPKRQMLIEWLILQLAPNYQQQLNSEKKTSKTRRMLPWLWRFGVMPYSKHTKNLDLEKYVEGLIGQENSITLLFNLCTLLLESKRALKSREDSRFHAFLEDIYRNYDALINTEYDPYKVSFPAAYGQLNDEQFEQKYLILLDKIDKLQANQCSKEQRDNCQSNFEMIFSNFESNKIEFLKTYQRLSETIKRTLQEHKGMLGNWKKGSPEAANGRTISVSTQLPTLYRRYQEHIKLHPAKVGENSAEREEVLRIIHQLNSTVQL